MEAIKLRILRLKELAIKKAEAKPRISVEEDI